ncbi:NifU family protein [Bradyrhizobium sp. DASA03076]|uniref:Nitrogen fixation protein NifU n=1 Tax=Bradyrhizobium manausense TaxID=989370 RepID=A0A0R3EDN5_9BRAD|nr:NifU family protein [Bradyrhizobium manausense]KRQ17407.1 nitrogen fixation protein NifU [Bradyrhizobium manausense]
MLVETQQSRQSATKESSGREQIVRAVLDEIRPNLKGDGGDCELVGIDGNKIMVKLTGACLFCKLASVTLEGIQERLIERLGGFVSLIPVARTGHGTRRKTHRAADLSGQ